MSATGESVHAFEPTLEQRLAAAQDEGLEANVRRMLRFIEVHGAIEFQALGVRTVRTFEVARAAHAQTPKEALALSVEAETWGAHGIYVLPARLRSGVETRNSAPGAWHDLPKRGSTTDSDVAARHVLAVDFDVVRPSNTSATDEELARSIAMAAAAWPLLASVVGEDALALVHSGNGRQMWIALEGLLADNDTKLLAASVLAGCSALFSTETVKVDTKLFDAKRILPACGTTKRKGAPGIAERPHRRTAIFAPERARRLTLEQFRELHARLRADCNEAGRIAMDLALGIKVKPKTNGATNGAAAHDAGESPWATANALDSTQVAEWLDLYESGDLRCPGCGETQGVDVIDHGLKCQHNRCDGKGKKGFRTNIDLVMEVRGVDKRAAVNLLAERFGFEPLPDRHQDPVSDEREPYSVYRERQAAREREAVGDAKRDALVQCLSADEFFAAESNANLVIPALGICPGPPTGIVGQAYVGKTIIALASGLSVALGKSLWGTWSVQQGPWLHLDYEQGRRHTKSRVHRLARGFDVSDDDLRALIEARTIRVAVLPSLRLTTDKALEHFVRAFDGVRLVTCDSLRQMLGGVDENSSQVRSLMGVLSAASDRTGAAVALIHHAGKTPTEGVMRTRKEMARGSSAIVDEMQSMFVMSKKKGDVLTLVTHEKDRELGGDPVADFGLAIEDVPTDEGNAKGGLRVVHVDREQMKGKPDEAPARFTKTKAAVRDCIRDNPGIAGAGAVTQIIGGTAVPIRAAVGQLVADGVVVERKLPGRGRGRRLYISHMAPPEDL